MTKITQFLLPIVAAGSCALWLAFLWISNPPFGILVAVSFSALAVEKIWRDYLSRKEQS